MYQVDPAQVNIVMRIYRQWKNPVITLRRMPLLWKEGCLAR